MQRSFAETSTNMSARVNFYGSDLEAREYIAPVLSNWAEENELTVACWNQHGHCEDRICAHECDFEVRFWSVPVDVGGTKARVEVGSLEATVFNHSIPSGADDCYQLSASTILQLKGLPERYTLIYSPEKVLVAVLDAGIPALHVVFDLPHWRAPTSGSILTEILNSFQLAGKKLSAQEKLIQRIVLTRKRGIVLAKDTIETLCRGIEDRKTALSNLGRKLTNTESYLKALENSPSVTLEFLDLLEARVSSLSSVHTVKLTLRGLEVETECLYFQYQDTSRQLGRIKILVTWAGEIMFKPKATYGPSVHPHVDRHGIACWPHGGFTEELARLVIRGQPEVAIQYLISGFLQHINVGDTYYQPSKWKKAIHNPMSPEIVLKDEETEPTYNPEEVDEETPDDSQDQPLVLEDEESDEDDEDAEASYESPLR